MSLNLNRVLIAGNVTRDPQTRLLGSGSAVADFGLAINRRWKSENGETKEEVTFVDVSCFGKTAEVVNDHVTKGKGVYIEGRLKLEQWEDKEGGKRSKLKVIADNVQFTDSKPKSDDGEAPAAAAPAPAPSMAKRPTAAAPRRPTPVQAPVDDEPPF